MFIFRLHPNQIESYLMWIINHINQILSYGCAVYNKTTPLVCNIVNEKQSIQNKYNSSIPCQSKT